MSGIADKGQDVFTAIDDALEQLVARQAQFDERLLGVEAGVRLELFSLHTEIRTERQINRDTLGAADRRIDLVQQEIRRELADIKKLIGGLRG
jgi:hypothetical protein